MADLEHRLQLHHAPGAAEHRSGRDRHGRARADHRGEPLSDTKIVHADAAGFMAATLGPGMRAVSIPITTESGAGGFILPNDRVDLIMSTIRSPTIRAASARGSC